MAEIIVRPNGPFSVIGEGVVIKDADGNSFPVREKTSLCRCGGSKMQPYCDGQHKAIGFVNEVKAPATVG